MGYHRVIPRDLFNDADLLKCIGRLWILTDGIDGVFWTNPQARESFQIFQNDDDGSTYVQNVTLYIRNERCRLSRPLNSREPWPLYLTFPDDSVIPVFDGQGGLSSEMENFLHEVSEDDNC